MTGQKKTISDFVHGFPNNTQLVLLLPESSKCLFEAHIRRMFLCTNYHSTDLSSILDTFDEYLYLSPSFALLQYFLDTIEFSFRRQQFL